MASDRESRAVASILGGAIGDALGVTKEVFPKSETADGMHFDVLKQRMSFQTIQRDYKGGGPWQNRGLSLNPGEWTDDTAMLLCLADSLLFKNCLDVGDLMWRFVRWFGEGYNSCRSFSFGIGSNVKNALLNFDPGVPDRLCGGTDPEKHAGNGCLMRLAPVPVYWLRDQKVALEMARLQSATTHNVDECLDGCALLAFIIWQGINGVKKTDLFSTLAQCPDLSNSHILELVSPYAKWRKKQPEDIRTLPGRCLWSLEAALWCVESTCNFEDALVRAINLGGDADTVGSITGQIAGALYGQEGVPMRWLTDLKHCNQILARAKALARGGEYDEETMSL